MGEPVIISFPPKMPRLPASTIIWGIVVIVLLILGAKSYYQVEPNQTGVVLRFGKFHKTAGPGPHFLMPIVDSVIKIKTDYQFKKEFGFRTTEADVRSTYQKEGFDAESLMLTGDLNIADVEWIVQYQINDPQKYLFNLKNVVDTIRDVSETAMRAAVGDLPFDQVIKAKREAVEIAVKKHMQELLNQYDVGIGIKLVQLQDVHPPDPVKDSFDEVNRAKQEMERTINEAQREYNKIIYQAQGEAKKRVSEAEGYAVERVKNAQGDGQRFEELVRAYAKAREVTRRRLYLETMQKVMQKAGRVYIVDSDQKSILPYLPLGQEVKK